MHSRHAWWTGQFVKQNGYQQWPTIRRRNRKSSEAVKKYGKAASIDNITAELLKASGTSAMKSLGKIYKKVWKQGGGTGDWLKAIVVPILKKGYPANWNNYGGIHLFSVSEKIMMKLTVNRLEEVIDEEQCSFRPAQSCIDQAFTLRQLMGKKENGN